MFTFVFLSVLVLTLVSCLIVSLSRLLYIRVFIVYIATLFVGIVLFAIRSVSVPARASSCFYFVLRSIVF